jgi:large subunit ribosomal protein L13
MTSLSHRRPGYLIYALDAYIFTQGSCRNVKTFSAKPHEIEREWFVFDAEGQTLGRLATRIASVLRGKHKPIYTPHVDCGDFVIVVNADKIEVTGQKLDQKMYYRHSGYPGGLRQVTLRRRLETHPERVIESAVRGMLPKNRLGRKMYKKLKVYAGPDHPHQAQKPKPMEP